MNYRSGKTLWLGAVLMAFALVASACGTKSEADPNAPVVGTVTASGISPDRCAANKAAGQLTYLTSFDYAASASILDVVAADAQGYFKKMCLDVKLQPGFTTANVPIVSAGKAQFSSLSSASEVAADVQQKANIEAIAMYGHTSVDELAVSDKANINNIDQIKGTTMGVLGLIPYDVQVMLVDDGVPLNSFKQMQVPQDPTLLDKGGFASRPVYKSAEPFQLNQAGIKYHVYDPSTQNIPASFGAMIVNTGFAKQHPTAVEDFLRADLEGFNYAVANPAAAVHDAFVQDDPKYYLTQAGEDFRWATESSLVKSSTPPGKPYGYMDAAEWNAEIQPLMTKVKIIPQDADVSRYYDTRFLNDIYNGTDLVWPSS